MRKWLIGSIRVLTVLIPLAAISLLAYPRRGLLWLAITGRSPTCSLWQTLNVSELHRRQREAMERLEKQTRVIQRDQSGLELWDTPKGQFWMTPQERPAFLLAELEQKLYGSGKTGVRPGDVVLDCGAFVGVYTREARRMGARLVVAVEPSPRNLVCLRRNLASEVVAGRVIIYPKGVWDTDGFLTLSEHATSSARDSFVIHERTREGPKVPLTTIDNLVWELQLDRVDFIKMDIEGAERRALLGARNTLARFKPRMAISSYHLADDPEQIPRAVRQAWSRYRMQCGQCYVSDDLVKPEVIFFY